MIVRRIHPCTRILGAPLDWVDDGSSCVGLPVYDIDTPQGHFMLSAWEPTPQELAKLNAGESLKLWIRGDTHPVVTLTVGDLET